MIKPEKLRSWIEQVEDEDTTVEDYDFVDRLTHGGPEHNGSGGLANVGAFLAIHEEDGEIVVEEDLVEALDEKQAEKNVTRRFRNIVYDAQTSKREGNTLYDRGVDGHGFLEDLLIEFEREVDVDSLPLDDESLLKVYSQNQSSNHNKGGDNSKMVDDEYNHQLNTLAGKLNQMDQYSTEIVHDAARIERKSDNAIDAAETLIDEYRDTGIDIQRGVQSWVDEQLNKLDGVNAAQESTLNRLNSFENDYLSGDYGISDSAKQAFSDAAGYDIT